jgi:hypothetical protein
MTKYHRRNRNTEREGVNAARTFFERCGCVFVEIGLENDYGKDAHVDLGNDVSVTSICAGVQIKSGVSYRHNGDYRIPLSSADLEYWKESTVPMIGIVYDPDDGLLRWVNITQYLCASNVSPGSYIPVDGKAILSLTSLRGEFTASVKNTMVGFRRHPLAQLCDRSAANQYHGILDCFTLGRADPRLFVGLRHMLFQLEPSVLQTGISALAHLTPHPDIFWSDKNWFPQLVTDQVRSHFRWSEDEVSKLLAIVPAEEWQRGQLGQSIYMLLLEDPEIDKKLEAVAKSSIHENFDIALLAIYLLLDRAGEEGLVCLEQLAKQMPTLNNNSLIREIRHTLCEYGSVSFW